MEDLINKVRRQIVLRIAVAGSQETAAKVIEQHGGVDRVEMAKGAMRRLEVRRGLRGGGRHIVGQ